jgi:hypothetical protein
MLTIRVNKAGLQNCFYCKLEKRCIAVLFFNNLVLKMSKFEKRYIAVLF